MSFKFFNDGINEAIEIDKNIKNLNKDEIIDNLMKYVLAIYKGEIINNSSGIENWKHAASSLFFLSENDKKIEKIDINLLLLPQKQISEQIIRKQFNKKQIKKIIQEYSDKNSIPTEIRGLIFNEYIDELKTYDNEEKVVDKIKNIYLNYLRETCLY